MKKFIVNIIVLLVFFVIGCTGNKTVKKDDTKKEDVKKIDVKDDTKKVDVDKNENNLESEKTEEDVKQEFNTMMAKYKLDSKENNLSFTSYIELSNKINADYKKYPEIGFNKGVFYTKVSKFEEAYQYLLETYKKSKYVPAIINLAFPAYKLNKIKEILPYLEEASKLKDLDMDTKEKLLVNYSFLLIINKDYDKAIDVIREILSFKPRSILAYKNLGILYTNNKKYSLAEKVIDLSISYTKDKKEQADLYVVKARFYKAKVESVKMIASYQKAISLDKVNIDANYALGLLYMKYGAGDKSVVYLETLISNYPNNILFKNLYAISLRMAKKYEKSLEVYSDLIKLEPNYKDTYYNRGLLLQKYLEKPDKAIDDYNKYKSLGGKLNIDERIKICKQMVKDIEQMKAEEENNKTNN
jgi:tetratricopeptide (TPR) repeat protein